MQTEEFQNLCRLFPGSYVRRSITWNSIITLLTEEMVLERKLYEFRPHEILGTKIRKTNGIRIPNSSILEKQEKCIADNMIHNPFLKLKLYDAFKHKTDATKLNCKCHLQKVNMIHQCQKSLECDRIDIQLPIGGSIGNRRL